MQAPGEEEAPDELDAAAGEEELPDTLGGAPGDAEGEPEELEADVERDFSDQNDSELTKFINPELLNDEDDFDEDDIEEVRNYGSTGDRAEIAVDKGKDLFDPDEDLFTTVYGTDKQTASDPFDTRSQKSLISRPFSVNSGNGVACYVREAARKSQILEKKLRKIGKVLKS